MNRVERLFGENAGMVADDDFRLLLAANAMGALGTALVSPVLDSLTGPFGVSAARIGLMVTAVAAPSILLIPLSGALTDRLGRKPVLVAGLVLFGGGGLGIAFTTEFRVVLGLRAIQGVGFAGVTPVIITCLGDLYEGDAEATAQGIRFGVSGLSQAIFPAIAGIVVVVAWQYPFLIYGLALPIAVVVATFFEEPAGAVTDGPEPEDGYLAGLARLASRPRVLAYLLARAIVVMPFIGFLTYNSLVVGRLQGGSPGQAGLLVALFSVVYAIAATQTGRIAAGFDRPTTPLVAANVLVGGGLAVFALSPSIVLAAPAVAAMGVGVGVTFSLYRSIITGLAPQQFRGGLVSIAESGGRLVATLPPVAVGVALSALEPAIGPASALRWIVVAAGLLAGAIGVASVVFARVSSPVGVGTAG